MPNNIKVEESNSDNDTSIILTITDVKNEQEALAAAEEWCDENNSLIVDKPFQDSQLSKEGNLVFNVKVGSDDYH